MAALLFRAYLLESRVVDACYALNYPIWNYWVSEIHYVAETYTDDEAKGV